MKDCIAVVGLLLIALACLSGCIRVMMVEVRVDDRDNVEVMNTGKE